MDQILSMKYKCRTIDCSESKRASLRTKKLKSKQSNNGICDDSIHYLFKATQNGKAYRWRGWKKIGYTKWIKSKFAMPGSSKRCEKSGKSSISVETMDSNRAELFSIHM